MYVHHEAKIVYLAHPRTASASTAEALQTIGFEKPVARDHHCRIFGPHSPVTPENRDSWFSFTAVRNHWDAAISWGYMRHVLEPPKNWNLAIFERILNTPWIEPNRMWWHATGADAVLRFETLQTELDGLLKALRLPTVTLPRKNVAEERISPQSGKSRDYREYYDAKSRDYIQQRFDDEIQSFGYVF